MTETAKALFKQSPATALLISFLSPVAKKEDHRVLTYTELSAVAHHDVKHEGRCYLTRAIIRVAKDEHKLFICVRDVGIKLGTDAEVSAIQTSTRQHCHRAARGAREKATLVNLEKLTDRVKLAHMSEGAILGLIEASTRGIAQKRLEAVFDKPGPHNLEAGELLRLAGISRID